MNKLKKATSLVLGAWLINSCSILISTRTMTVGNATNHSQTTDKVHETVNGGGLDSSADPTTNAALNQKESDTMAEMVK